MFLRVHFYVNIKYEFAQVEQRSDANNYIVMNIRTDVELLAKQSLELLMEKSDGEMKLSQFMTTYQMQFSRYADLVSLKHELYPAILVSFVLVLCILCYYPPKCGFTFRVKVKLIPTIQTDTKTKQANKRVDFSDLKSTLSASFRN